MNTSSTLTSTATLMSPSMDISFPVPNQHDPAQSMDGLDATIAAFHLGLHLRQGYEANPKRENLSSPIYSPTSTSSCQSSTAGDIPGGQPTAFHTHVSQGYQHEDRKAFDTLFTEQELNLDLDNPGVPKSSTSPTSVSFKVEDGSERHRSGDFGLFQDSLTLNSNMDSSSNLDSSIPTSTTTIESSSPSPTSSPSSSTPSSPSPPSYDDSMIPVIACASCKKSHIKCDHGRPCQNCRKNPNKAETCHDAVPKPRGRPKGVIKPVALDIITESRIPQQQQHPGFYIAPENPYRYLHDQPDQPQFHRQRALSFPHSSLHEPSTYILQSQQLHPQPHLQQPQQPHQYQLHHHHQPHLHHQPHQQQQLQQQQEQQQLHFHHFHQRAGPHPQARIAVPDSHVSMPDSGVDFHRVSPSYASGAPYTWGNGSVSPGVPEIKSMPFQRRSTVASAALFEVHARPSQPIPVQVPPHASASGRYFGGGAPHAVQAGAMFASLPSHFSAPLSNSPPTLDAYQLHQLQQHRQKLHQQQQLELLQKRNSQSQAQPQAHPHPAMQNQSFFS